MKVLLLCLMICFIYTYDTEKAIKYARKYCNIYNPHYYHYGTMGDCANFVSQCLVAGGEDFKGCNGVNSQGTIEIVSYLEACLTFKGWKRSYGMNKDFKAGYPFFMHSQHAMIATSVRGNTLRFCAHTNDRCDSLITASSSYIYYYQ